MIVPLTTSPAFGAVTVTSGGVVSSSDEASIRSAQSLGLKRLELAGGALKNRSELRRYWKVTPSVSPTDTHMSVLASVHRLCFSSNITSPSTVPAASVSVSSSELWDEPESSTWRSSPESSPLEARQASSVNSLSPLWLSSKKMPNEGETPAFGSFTTTPT